MPVALTAQPEWDKRPKPGPQRQFESLNLTVLHNVQRGSAGEQQYG